jgi:NADH-quinone oxidoreductase subunit I
MLPTPFPMSDGLEERDYYQGKVSGPTDAQRAYVDARDAGGTAADDDDAYAGAPGNVGAAVPGAHDLVHSTDPTAAHTREGANP